MKIIFSALILAIFIGSCSTFKAVPTPPAEFRGVWIATVANIDWPKNGSDNLEKKKKDYLALLDYYQAHNFNAVIVQLRTAGDALYPTKLAPWSTYLTGQQGASLKETVDIVPFLIKEAHTRGMEFHAWLNPYRATMTLDTLQLSTTHDFYQHKDWMIPYGTKYYYDPGNPEVQAHLAEIMQEVVQKYNIDALHFDDYFYPYTIKDQIFADSTSYANYNPKKLPLEDWRRSNVDSLIKNVYTTIKNTKPWVQFGISPFGVWKNDTTDPKGSATKAGQTTYHDLYANPLLWMEKGWIDYLVPQIYWSMDFAPASHKILADWWSTNAFDSRIYIGNGPYKIKNNADIAWENPLELPTQLNYVRSANNISGNVFFSAKSLLAHEEVAKTIHRKLYKHKAYTPSHSPLYDAPLPQNITVTQLEKKDKNYIFNIKSEQKQRSVLIYKKEPTEPKGLLGKRYLSKDDILRLPIKLTKNRKKLVLVFESKYGQHSLPIAIKLN
ncbi:glycoside hydrolase family 10 protein [Flavobacterium sp. ASW18X]|uniref:glycoside hydrolase family 10 protein n=1 Tax=Flavobacterium sp. ASW18X TaxID=2572595 RepID=UPI0010AE09F0|nr:family 10 glycosylhydrolase [Flavobacterium sp. ASW18X]TKD62494.1 glycosyl hydrolase [Flavobacterium sp. ASW18X]